MKERITKVVDKSRVVWENLEAWVRERIQVYVQDLLEEEVTVLLGREKSDVVKRLQRRPSADSTHLSYSRTSTKARSI